MHESERLHERSGVPRWLLRRRRRQSSRRRRGLERARCVALPTAMLELQPGREVLHHRLRGHQLHRQRRDRLSGRLGLQRHMLGSELVSQRRGVCRRNGVQGAVQRGCELSQRPVRHGSVRGLVYRTAIVSRRCVRYVVRVRRRLRDHRRLRGRVVHQHRVHLDRRMQIVAVRL